MHTRLRELRKQHGLTLQELARRVGTTPQTVQRLETASITVSVDWLERFARAFSIDPADLIARSSQRGFPLIGTLDGRGRLNGRTNLPFDEIVLSAPGSDCIAVRLTEPIGSYAAGAILVAARQYGADMRSAHGHDALVETKDGVVLLRRVAFGDGGLCLMPLEPDDDIRFNVRANWVARLLMRVDYL